MAPRRPGCYLRLSLWLVAACGRPGNASATATDDIAPAQASSFLSSLLMDSQQKRSYNTRKNKRKFCRKKAMKDLKYELGHFSSTRSEKKENYINATFCREKVIDYYCDELVADATTYPQCAKMKDNSMLLDFYECYPELEKAEDRNRPGEQQREKQAAQLSSGPPARIVYFLTVNDNVAAVANLYKVLRIEEFRHLFLVHLDAKMSAEKAREVEKNVEKLVQEGSVGEKDARIHILPRKFRIIKGGNQLLKAKLYGIQQAAARIKRVRDHEQPQERVPAFDFFIHLSETHAVLRPGIESYLSFYRGYNFVAMDNCWQQHCARPLGFSCGDESVTFRSTTAGSAGTKLHMHKPVRFRQRFARGPEWVVLSRRFVEEIASALALEDGGDHELKSQKYVLFPKKYENVEWEKVVHLTSADDDSADHFADADEDIPETAFPTSAASAAAARNLVYLIRDALAQYQSDEAFFPQALRHSYCCSRAHLNANLHLNGLVQPGWMKRVFHGELDKIGTSSPGYLEEFMAGSSVEKSLRPAAEWIVVNFFPPRTSGAEVGNTPLSHGEYFFARKVRPEHQGKFLLAELDVWRWQNTAYDHVLAHHTDSTPTHTSMAPGNETRRSPLLRIQFIPPSRGAPGTRGDKKTPGTENKNTVEREVTVSGASVAIADASAAVAGKIKSQTRLKVKLGKSLLRRSQDGEGDGPLAACAAYVNSEQEDHRGAGGGGRRAGTTLPATVRGANLFDNFGTTERPHDPSTRDEGNASETPPQLAVLWANPFVEPKSYSKNDVMVVPDSSYEIRVYNATGRSRAKLFSLTVARTKLLPWFDGGVSNRAGFIHVIELAPCLWENLVAKNTGGVAVRVSAERVDIGEQVFSFGTNELIGAEQGVKRAEEVQEGRLSTEAGRGRDERHGLKPAMSMSVNHTAGTLMSWSEARPSSQKQKMSSKNNRTLPITNPFAQFGHCWKKYDF